MSESIVQSEKLVSDLADGLVGSEIIKIAGEINARIANGEQITNLTIGDFNPEIYPLPELLLEEIIAAYRAGHTNYPQANGMEVLRQAVSNYINDRQGLLYSKEDVLVSGGARPLIYATYRTLVNRGEKVIFPIPSWNNNHYAYLNFADPVVVETLPENRFLPTADDLRPHVSDARLIALCSPLNPTGTSYTEAELSDICDLILEENQRRVAVGDKPLYLLYDQIYWALTLGGTKHVDPVSLRPEMAEYTVFIDGISKAFAATGVRVGWAFGPNKIMVKMKSLLSHIGAWAPKAEQIAVANFLQNGAVVQQIIEEHRTMISERVNKLFNGISALKEIGYPVAAIQAEGAMYLTVKIDLIGRTSAEGETMDDAEDVTMFLIREAKLGIVPFYCFGASRKSPWFRISVGTLKSEDITGVLDNLRQA
ncbi:MAG: aminotransferase class I/II-fold pyridoxal phosphate-dependent enzyme, partial [Flavobacteriales bacterium]|nr:aminotransferase class I/II-fold pyridoxal phosphate-dependent enzyme [Flavobacteriales bacterium]